MADARIAFKTHGFAVVVCRHPTTGKWLAVNESRQRGWWLPAGHVDRGQTFVEAAHRETEEEAGIAIKLVGVLAVEHTLSDDSHARMRVVFLATPRDPAAPPKAVPDHESEGAAWLTVGELEALAGHRPPQGLRGRELLHWARYLEAGGQAAPLGVLQKEQDGPGQALMATVGGGAPASAPPPRPPPQIPGTATATSPDVDLLAAVGRGDAAGVRAALLRGAPGHLVFPAIVDAALAAKQWTALHVAVRMEALEVVRALLIGGANPNAATHKGRTCLAFAVAGASAAITRLLLMAGANADLADCNGVTCRQAATAAHRALLG